MWFSGIKKAMKAKDARSWSVKHQEYIRREAVDAVLKKKQSISDVAKRFSVTRQAIHKWIKKYKNDGFISLKIKKGRPVGKSLFFEDQKYIKYLIENYMPNELEFFNYGGEPRFFLWSEKLISFMSYFTGYTSPSSLKRIQDRPQFYRPEKGGVYTKQEIEKLLQEWNFIPKEKIEFTPSSLPYDESSDCWSIMEFFKGSPGTVYYIKIVNSSNSVNSSTACRSILAIDMVSKRNQYYFVPFDSSKINAANYYYDCKARTQIIEKVLRGLVEQKKASCTNWFEKINYGSTRIAVAVVLDHSVFNFWKGWKKGMKKIDKIPKLHVISFNRQKYFLNRSI